MFDVNEFMNASVDTAMSTQMIVCPEGEYPFMIGSDAQMLVPKNLTGISNKTGKPYDFWQLELTCLCMSDEVKQKLKRDNVPVRLRINLDLEGGKLKTGEGENVALGRLREALGQNKPGWKPADLLNAGPFIGKVEHSQGKDGAVYADIGRVAKIS